MNTRILIADGRTDQDGELRVIDAAQAELINRVVDGCEANAYPHCTVGEHYHYRIGCRAAIQGKALPSERAGTRAGLSERRGYEDGKKALVSIEQIRALTAPRPRSAAERVPSNYAEMQDAQARVQQERFR